MTTRVKVLRQFNIDVFVKIVLTMIRVWKGVYVSVNRFGAQDVFKLNFSSANTSHLEQYQYGEIWLTSRCAAAFDYFLLPNQVPQSTKH